MISNPVNNYLLIAPIGILSLAFALMIAWNFQRDQKYLLWMSLGLALTSMALGIQSIVEPEYIAKLAIYTGSMYLFGAWLASKSIADKFNASSRPRTATVIGSIALGLLYYYSQINDNISVRIYVLCIALGLIQILPAPQIFKNKPRQDNIETILYYLYLVFCIYTMARSLIFVFIDHLDLSDFSKSQYWFITLLGSMLVCMIFTFLLLACAIRTAFNKLRAERNHDPLTELLNRRAFQEAATTLLQDPKRHPVSIMLCDIDHFKNINDTLGHDTGDDVLRHVSHTLRQSTRSRDLVARMGGEEFAFLMTNTSLDTAQAMAQRIQDQLKHDIHAMSHTPITLSFGAVMAQEGETLAHAIKRADMQLYTAKRLGRDRICTEQTPYIPAKAAA